MENPSIGKGKDDDDDDDDSDNDVDDANDSIRIFVFHDEKRECILMSD